MENFNDIIFKIKKREDKSIKKGDRFVFLKNVDKVYHCPKCKSVLIKRLSKFGENKYWYGCSGYPSCKYTCNEKQVK